MRRFGSVQVRVSGTVGGNIANGSPIGDIAPALIALGGRVVLRKGGKTRTLPLEDFFIAYGKQDREPGEFVLAVEAPPLGAGQHYRAFKVSKRFDEDISAVMLAVRARHRGPTDRWRAHRLRRHGGDAQARPERRAGVDRGEPRRACELARRARGTFAGFHPLDRPARERGLSHDGRRRICSKRRCSRFPARARRPGSECSMPPNDMGDLALATAVVHKPLPHNSARLHVQGSANYVDDIREPEGTLHVAIGMADKARGRLKSPGRRGGACGARRRRRADGGRHSRQERRGARVRRRAAVGARGSDFPRPGPVRGRRPHPRSGAAGGAARQDGHRRADARGHHRRRARLRRAGAGGLRLRARRRRRRDRRELRIGWRANWRSAARSISISKARLRSPCRAKATR